jgi:hypothetical protein
MAARKTTSTATTATAPRRGRGRPPKGPEGVAVRTLPTLSIRLTPENMALLKAASKVTLQSASEVVAAALVAWAAKLPRADRADVERQAERERRELAGE